MAFSEGVLNLHRHGLARTAAKQDMMMLLTSSLGKAAGQAAACCELTLPQPCHTQAPY